MSDNSFPESPQKAYLRRRHLADLAGRKLVLGRGLDYLGLPSEEMLDIKLWQSVLRRITAVERDQDLVLAIYRTAEMLGIRSQMTILEQEFAKTAQLLAMDEHTAELSLASLSLPEAQGIRKARSAPYDVINLDLCGGFLYPTASHTSENVQLLSDLIGFQARHKHPFTLILTFNIRDTGRGEYDAFITDTLQGLKNAGVDTAPISDFYLYSPAKKQKRQQSPQLRRLRFCVPTYLHKVAHQHFQATSLGSWYYKTFYHTSLLFEPRQGGSVLGQLWPPVDEVAELLNAPMWRIDKDAQSEVTQTLLHTPAVRLNIGGK